MHWNVSYDLERGQSLNISTDKLVVSLKSPPNIPDKLVIAYGNDMGFEYTSLYGEGEIRKDESSSNYYYNFHIKDHLGSTRMVITDASNINEAIMYQPYGTMEELSVFSSSATPAREKFTSKEYDKDGENGVFGIKGMELFYFGARFLDPDLGIWISFGIVIVLQVEIQSMELIPMGLRHIVIRMVHLMV
ncbi:MAG TPA: hypothetical protein VHP36_04655 [Chitinispirillaceae bacterium]|nr:hypothetical protein [Chitinispirillaceae bacterium]